jgi:Poly A polymerase head domain
MPQPGATAKSLKGAAWLTQGPLAQLLEGLDRDGEEARAVGGAVRNALFGEPIAEIDVATTAVPEEVVKRAIAAGFKPVPTGIEHGTITVVIDKRPFEVTTLRRDVETYGRHAKVAFGRDWKTDAERRDFTINALSTARDGTVYDYVGSPISTPAACALSAIPSSASKKIICASCASSVSTRATAAAIPMWRGLRRASPAATASSSSRGSACAWN